MSVIIKGFDKPEDCLSCPFLSKLTEVSVGSEGLYKKIGYCKFASDIMPDLEDPWHDVKWLLTHTEEWCPITQINEWPEINVDIQMTEEELKEAINDFDLIIRPKALILSPEMKEALLEAEPDIEKKLVLVVSPCVYDTAYLVDRKKLEEFSRYTIESEDQN